MDKKLLEIAHLFLKKKFNQKGAVLVEFAFCCPVLIIFLFFVLDVPLAYRVVSKMNKMSEVIACMIRNVPGKENLKITLTDLKNISKASGIIMTGKLGSKSNPCTRYPFYLSTYVICIVGTKELNNFEKKWAVHIKNKLYDGTIEATTNTKGENFWAYSQLKNVNSFDKISRFSGYKIQEGEVKLIVETVAWYKEGDNSMEKVNVSGVRGSGILGDYSKNMHSIRGFNKGFYLLTIPGKTSGTIKTFGNSYAVIPSVDEIIDITNCPG